MHFFALMPTIPAVRVLRMDAKSSKASDALNEISRSGPLVPKKASWFETLRRLVSELRNQKCASSHMYCPFFRMVCIAIGYRIQCMVVPFLLASAMLVEIAPFFCGLICFRCGFVRAPSLTPRTLHFL